MTACFPHRKVVYGEREVETERNRQTNIEITYNKIGAKFFL